MRKYFLTSLGVAAVIIIFVSIILIGEQKSSDVIDIDDVVLHPEQYSGEISVSGTVNEVGKDDSYFMLGCEDACIMMPVRYEGIKPARGNNVIVSGKVTETENGKYQFVANKIQSQ